MEPFTARAVAAGYRKDWRGVIAFAFAPEKWSTPAWTAYLLAAGATLGVILNNRISDGIVGVAIYAFFTYLAFVRPILRSAEKRAKAD